MGTLLVCIDGSDLAMQAAVTGLELLRRSDDRVVLTTVVEPSPTGLSATMPQFGAQPGMPPPVSADHEQVMARAVVSQGQQLLIATAAELDLTDDENVELRVIDGKPGEALVALADEVGASAIVMASRGVTGFRRAVLGSVSDYVTRNATCPVLIVPGNRRRGPAPGAAQSPTGRAGSGIG